MQEQKKILGNVIVLLVCILTSLVLVSLAVPPFLDWYATPFLPHASCAPSIQWALKKMLWLQMVSVILGAVLGVFILLKFRKKKSSS